MSLFEQDEQLLTVLVFEFGMEAWNTFLIGL
jgi:hypothetical protein